MGDLDGRRPTPAGLVRRGAARGVDLVLLAAVTTFLVVPIVPHVDTIADAVGMLRVGGELTPARAIANVVAAVSALAYFVGFEATRSTTPGKIACGLRVVNTHGTPIDRRQALIRNSWLALPALPLLGTLALGLFGFMIAITIVANRARIGWHDELAGTAVVRPAGPGRDRSVPR